MHLVYSILISEHHITKMNQEADKFWQAGNYYGILSQKTDTLPIIDFIKDFICIINGMIL